MKKVQTFILIFIYVMFVFSCISYQKDNSEKDGESSGDELILALSPSNINFNPIYSYTSMEAQFYTAIYEGLVTYHPITLRPLPALASHWEISENGQIYTFYLRENALFNNGDDVTAQDVKNSWIRLIDPSEKAEYSVYYDIIKGVKEYRNSDGSSTEVIGIKAKSEKILEIELNEPATHFLKLLCHMSFVPVHPEYLKKKNWGFDRSILSNGPYYLFDRSDKEMIFVKNNLYWNKDSVEIEKIRVLFTEDRQETSRMFNNYHIHWAFDWDTELLDNSSYIVINPMFATSYYFFVCKNPPWNDPRIRRGLVLLLPWNEIRSEDFLFTTDTLVPALTDYPEVKGISKKNEEEGMELLDEAGYPEGKGLPKLTIKIPEDRGSGETIKLIADTWKEKCDMDIEIKVIPFPNYFSELKKDDYTLGVTTWIGDFADPLTYLQMWTGDSTLNESGFNNPKYDKLIDDSMKEEDRETRFKLLAEAEEILLYQAVVIPLRHTPAFNLINDNLIEGWFPNPLDIHPFIFIRFKEEKIYPRIVRKDNTLIYKTLFSYKKLL